MKPHLPLFKRGVKKNAKKNAPRVGGDLRRIGLAVATIAVLSVLLTIHLPTSRVDLRIGEISPDNIIARQTQRYLDTAATELRRERAAASAGRAYDPVPNAAEQAAGALKTILRTTEAVRVSYPRLALAVKVARVRARLGAILGAGLADGTYAALLQSDAPAQREIEDISTKILGAAMTREVRDEPAEIRQAKRTATAEAVRLVPDPARAAVVGQIVQACIRPNQVYDPAGTVARQAKARSETQPVYRLAMRGELVIGKGETVLQEHIDKFEALGLRNPRFDFRSTISLCLFIVLVVLLVLAYLARYYPEVYANTKTLLLLALIVTFGTFALRIGGSMLGIKLTADQVGFLGIMWVTTAGMLIAVLLNPQIAVVISSLLAIVLSMLLSNELRYAGNALITSLVGIYSVANIRHLSDLMRAVGALAATGVFLVWIVGGISNDPVSQMLTGSVWAVAIAAGAAMLLFPIGTRLLERPFDTTTHVSLLELADTNKPLLRHLSLEAPGTYTHSMAVGHLAESAAEALGADSLAARVASYYHDIGKIRRPHFFIENQPIDNVHDRMNPTLSALVITSHIKDGIEVARQYRLPKSVQDVIAQHHGTSLVQYFYNQFTGEHDPSTAVEQQFRYAGPKPQTREAAIVMLADSVEAASRCLSKPTPAKIELMVNRVVSDKLRDGQLDESDLTFREISKITEAFIRALMGTMHARIEYTDVFSSEGRKAAANAGTGSELAEDNGQARADQETGPTVAAGGERPG